MSQNQIIAAIDVGSNSIKMLAAEIKNAGFFVIPSYKTIPARLQAGMQKDKTLDPASLKRGEDAIDELARYARSLGAVRICAFGTSALRDAVNAGELVKRAMERSQVELRIISGEEEAKSSFLAVCPAARSVIVNPGGGSTEITIGTGDHIDKAVSVHTGAVSLSAECSGLGKDEVLQHAAEHILSSIGSGESYRNLPVILSGGAVSCAAAVIKSTNNMHDWHGDMHLALAKIEDLYKELFYMPIQERLKLRGMVPSRADILPYGLAIIINFMRITGAEQAEVTLRDNLFGFLRMMSEI